jgi:hypothetical protein
MIKGMIIKKKIFPYNDHITQIMNSVQKCHPMTMTHAPCAQNDNIVSSPSTIVLSETMTLLSICL